MYDEQIIDGILCYKLKRNSEWKEYTKEELTEKIRDLEATIQAIYEE